MRTYHMYFLPVAVSLLASCASTQYSSHRTTSEKVENVLDSKSADEVQQESAIGATIVAYFAAKGITYVTEKAADYIESKAKKFGASYSAVRIVDDGEKKSGYGATIQVNRRLFNFRRTVIFSSRSAAKLQVDLSKLYPGTTRDTKRGFEVDTVLFDFELVPSGSGQSVRIVPKSMVYQGSEAIKPRSEVFDLNQLKLVISCTMRYSARSPYYQTVTSSTETSGATFFDANVSSFLSKEGKVEKKEFPASEGSDWFPAPTGGAYSMKVSVTETTKPKEWINKAAEKLGEYGKELSDDAATAIKGE